MDHEAQWLPHHTIISQCRQAAKLVRAIRSSALQARQEPGSRSAINSARNARLAGQRFIEQRARRFLETLDQYHPRELDLINGCLQRVESALGGSDSAALHRLRGAIGRRLRAPGYG